ncbi:MAG: adenylyltransferase/cytidyltransferase family protein [Roseibacillus sp.]
MKTKVSSLDDLVSWRVGMETKGAKVVLTNGCFDLVHCGHLKNLQYSASLGDSLVVAVNSDSSVRTLKGPNRPLIDEVDRAELLGGFECVDKVVIFSEVRLTKVIERLRPDIYVKGGDYTVETLDRGERKALEDAGCEIFFFDLLEGRSTSSLFDRIKQT